jgi:flagellar basal-body rod protein FlgF
MDPGLVSSLSGALAQSRRIDVVANNIANADTPGFKADDLSFEEIIQGSHREDSRSDIPERPYTDAELLSRAGDERRAVLYGAEFTDLKEGAFRRTGQNLDIAIEGNGFLEVLTPQGIRLTRAGNLALDAGGRLITREGYLVLGQGAQGADPALRAITVGNEGFVVDATGAIFSDPSRGGAPLGALSLQQVGNPAGLKKIGSNLFEATPDAALVAAGPTRGPASQVGVPNGTSLVTPNSPTPKPNPLGSLARAPRVHQGMIESSNVNPILEMTKMIEAQRLFEQNTKLMQTFGEMATRSSEIGRF